MHNSKLSAGKVTNLHIILLFISLIVLGFIALSLASPSDPQPGAGNSGARSGTNQNTPIQSISEP